MGCWFSKEEKEQLNEFFPNILKLKKLNKNNSAKNFKKRINNKPPFNKNIFEFKTEILDIDEEENNEKYKPKKRLSQKTQEMLRNIRNRNLESRFDIKLR